MSYVTVRKPYEMIKKTGWR